MSALSATNKQCRPALSSRRATVSAKAFFKKSSSVSVAEKPASKVPKKGEQQDSVLSAFDFATTRSKKDRELLWEAKYGNRNPDGKMSPEQYAALRRKVGGTAKDFFKSWVEEEQVKNIKTYTNPENAGGTVPYLPFLIAVVVGMLGTTVAVVAQTSS